MIAVQMTTDTMQGPITQTVPVIFSFSRIESDLFLPSFSHHRAAASTCQSPRVYRPVVATFIEPPLGPVSEL